MTTGDILRHSGVTDTIDRTSTRERWPIPGAGMAGTMMAVLPLVGVVTLLLMTRWGAGTSPDSVGYLQAARSIVATSGGALFTDETTGAVALTHFAPLYSVMLAAAGVAGADPYHWARWLNALLFGTTLLLVSLILRDIENAAGRLTIAGVLLVLTSVPILTVHVTVLSEPVFLLLTFLGWWLLARYLATSARLHLFLAALAIGLAWLARYAGLASVIGGGLALLVFGGRAPARRCLDAVLFVTTSSAGMAAWLVRNAMVSNSATGREVFFHPIDKSHFWQLLYTCSGWLMIPASAPNWVRVLAWCTLGAIAAGVLTSLYRSQGESADDGAKRRPREPVPIVVRSLALFVLTYLGFLAISISFVDANTPLDDRILSPVYIAVVVVAVWLAQEVRERTAPRPRFARLLAVGLVAFLGAQLLQGVRLAAASYAGGWGFSSRSWQASPTLDHVKALPESILIFSNAPELVYLHTRRDAQALPKRWAPMNRQPNPNYPAQMASVEHILGREAAVVVLFTGLRGEAATQGEPTLASDLHMRVWSRQPDGVILCAAVCPE